MKKIHKYPLRHMQHQKFDALPADIDILSIQQQGPDICMWVEVDPEEKVKEPLVIRTAVTGGEAPERDMYQYITTCQHGSLTLHYYRLIV